MLDETLEVVRRLWTEETVTFAGDHLHFDGAYCDPKPVQTLPPAAGGRRGRAGQPAHRRPAGRPHQLAGGPRRLRAQVPACWSATARRSGGRFADITRTHGPDCRIFDTDAEARAWCASEGGGDLWGHGTADEYLADNLVGTVEQVAEKAQAFVDAGCRGLVLWLRDYPADETLRRFMAEVVPKLRLRRGDGPVEKWVTSSRRSTDSVSGEMSLAWAAELAVGEAPQARGCPSTRPRGWNGR